jgi:hypothetical protein
MSHIKHKVNNARAHRRQYHHEAEWQRLCPINVDNQGKQNTFLILELNRTLLVKKTFSSQDNQDTDDHRDEQDRVAVARVVVCPLPSRLIQELLPHIVAQWSGRWHFSPSWLCSLLFLSILVAVVGSSLED